MPRLQWLALVLSLPTPNGTARMRVWRALKGMGCGVLRDGVYLLPDSVPGEQALDALQEEIGAAGGAVHLLRLQGRDEVQEAAFVALFDRSADYAALEEAIQKTQRELAGQPPSAQERAVRRLRRELEVIRAVDFFPGTAAAQTEAALTDLEAALRAALSPDEPHPAQGDIRRLDRSNYQSRCWATRRRPWIDRLASAWLIRRCIDPQACFLWLERPEDCPPEALGFDFDGAAFTHVGERVTFEVLLASFGLGDDSALTRLAAMVHVLDVGGPPVAEAQGFEAIVAGARQRIAGDDALLNEVTGVLDSLYAHYRDEARS